MAKRTPKTKQHKRMNHAHHKALLGFSAIGILLFGLVLGLSLSSKLGTLEFQVISLGLLLSIAIIQLINGGFILEIKDELHALMQGKR